MSTGYLKLTLGELTVTLDGFQGEDFPRAKVEPMRPETSALGSFISYGRFYEDRHLWNCVAVISPEKARILDALYWEHHRLRRTFAPAHFLLIDTTQPFQERSPRTRAIAPAPFNQPTTVATSFISYYAQFYAWFDAQPQFTLLGSRHQSVRLSLIEYSDKVPVV